MAGVEGGVRVGEQELLAVRGIKLCVQEFGEPGDPVVLLVGGAEASMDWWEDGFCVQLAARGLRVVRYDSRDTGRSTTFPVGDPGYSGMDLVEDAAALVEALGVVAVHLVGISAGGGVGQELALRYPERVLTLTLVATTAAVDRGPGRPELPPVSERLAAYFRDPAPEPDWSDRESVIGYLLAGQRAFAGELPVDEERIRRIAGQVFDRSPAPAAAANHWRVAEDPDAGAAPSRTLGDIAVPTLVLHGTADPLFPLAHGEALAAEIPGARLVALPGMGHQVPPPELWDVVIPAIAEHCGGIRGGA
ncbi:Aclacinomycin methylesterase RdmC [Streptomyces sp. RB5]|uniref:Aclacinomycin methylesterase RdmC n=1 Tax=Streptomyces smaragdinus TaxID=2585196 RepID=A0A7K0CUI0_9ACTN|nr:alpha/beta hydrolase [Streptomyces smaragdinus]MQY16354.1 Aclacinomycin methylesterase RdmC [Streptomyces smaragdinus]